MDFKELQAALRNVERLILKKRKELSGVDNEMNGLATEAQTDETNYQKVYAEEKRKEADLYRKKLTQGYEDKLIEQETKLSTLNTEYANELSELTEDKFMERCKSEKDIVSEVKESSAVLQERLQDAIGKHFYNALFNYLEDTTISISDKELEHVITYFEKSSKTIEMMTSKPDRIGEFITTLEQGIMSMSSVTLEQDNKFLLVLLVIILVIVFFASKYVFPFYMIFLCVLAVFNALRSYKFYKILIVQKAVLDNIKLIEDMMHDKVMQELSEKTEEVNAFYSKEIADTQHLIDKYRSELQKATITAENSFVFNDEQLRIDYDSNLHRREVKEATLAQKKNSLMLELQDLYKQKDDLKTKQDSIVGALQHQFMDFSKVGTDVVFNPRFLLDIISDSKGSQPIYFDHPCVSALFLYEDVIDAYNFQRLLIAQLRCKLSPFSLSVRAYDPTNLGQQLMLFKPKLQNTKDDASQLFKVLTKEDEFKQYIDESADEMLKRTDSVLRDFKNVGNYNTKMVELESLTLPYEFFLATDVSSSLLTSEKLQQLLRNGGALGLFTHLFINMSKFKALGDSAEELLESIGKIYILQSGSLKERAKSFISENFLSDS